MSEAGEAASVPESEGPQDEILRAKYFDYCSARVTEALMRLSPDEIYLLARESTEEEGGAVDAEGSVSFDALMRLATTRLSRTLGLPSFPEFLRRYHADPEEFEREMIGLWESGLRREPGSK